MSGVTALKVKALREYTTCFCQIGLNIVHVHVEGSAMNHTFDAWHFPVKLNVLHGLGIIQLFEVD